MPYTAPLLVPFAGPLLDATSGAVAILVGLSGLCGGVAHYLAVFAGKSHRQIELSTGAGFFAGVIVGVNILTLDLFV